jgi:hypothetical protein
LPEPPLDEDPFTSLNPADLTAMGDAPSPSTAGNDDNGNEYEDDDDDDYE